LLRQIDLKNDDLNLIHGSLCINAKSLLKVAFSTMFLYYFPPHPQSSQEALIFVRMAFMAKYNTAKKTTISAWFIGLYV